MENKKRNITSFESTFQNSTQDSKNTSMDVNLQSLTKSNVNRSSIPLNIHYQILFSKEIKKLNKIAGTYFKNTQDILKKKSVKLTNFFVKNQEVNQIYEEFSQLTSIYCYIIMTFIKNNNYSNAKNLLDTFFIEFKDTFMYCVQRIGKQYPNRGTTSNIFIFYHKMILKSIKGLSCLIYISQKLNKQHYHAFFITLYYRYISIVKQKTDLLVRPKSEGKTRENLFFCQSLSLGAYYFLWKIGSMQPSINFLYKILEIYKDNNEQDKTENELRHHYIIYHNLGILHYSEGQSEKALYALMKGLDICSALNELFTGSKFNLKVVNQMCIRLYLLIIEISIDKKDHYSAMQNIKKILSLMEKYDGATEEQNRILEVFLRQLNNSQYTNNKQQAKTGKIKEFKEILIGKPEPLNKTNHLIFEVEEIEKFCLFISSLSMYQIKILNDTQPIMKIRESLPICFSNQFSDCLSFSQRMSLLKIKVMSLYRFIILRDPELPITLNNINFNLFALREKQAICLKSTKSSIKRKRTIGNQTIPDEKTKEQKKKYARIFNDSSFVNKNRELLSYLFKSMNQDFKEECIKDPDEVKKRILRCKSELMKPSTEEEKRIYSPSRRKFTNIKNTFAKDNINAEHQYFKHKYVKDQQNNLSDYDGLDYNSNFEMVKLTNKSELYN